MFQALRHRNYRLFFAGQGVSVIGTWMQATVLSWLVLELANSPFMLGVSAAAASAPMLAFGLVGGALADRISKRRIIITTQTCLMLLAFALGMLVLSGHVRLWHLILASGIAGTIMAFDMPARQSFAVEMVGKEDLMNAIALNSSLFNGARIIGPSIAGVILTWRGPTTCFFANAVSFLAVIAALVMMRVSEPPARPRASLLADVQDGLRTIWSDRSMRAVVGSAGVFSIFGMSYATLVPLFARDILHSGARGYGLLLSSAGVGAVTGALTLAAIGRLLTARRLTSGALVCFSIGVVTFALSRRFPLSCACLALVGFSTMSYLATTNTLLQVTAADRVRGRVVSAYVWVTFGMAPLGALQIGTLAEHAGASLAMMVGGAIIVFLALLVSRAVPEMRLAGERELAPDTTVGRLT
jgi:MFS family permease